MHAEIATQSQTQYLATPAFCSTATASGLPEMMKSPVADTRAGRDRLVVENMVLVRQVARTLHARMPQHIDLEDLVSAGLVGLLDAAAKFDESRQAQFRSYAQIRVRGAILDSLRSLDWSPRELRRQSRAIAEAIRALSTQLGRTPDDAEIAAEMGLELRELHLLTGELKGLELGSLNQERVEDSNDEEIDYIAAPESENPFTLYAAGQSQQQMVEALATLPERERLVLSLYYYEELTLKEIGLTLGVVESRASQLRAAGVARLRRKLTVGTKGQGGRCPKMN